jgi:hypothetical protein
MTKLCPRGKAAAKRKFRVYPSAYANAYASKICAGKIKDPSGVKRKDFRGPKPSKAMGGRIFKDIGGPVIGSVKRNIKDNQDRIKSRTKLLRPRPKDRKGKVPPPTLSRAPRKGVTRPEMMGGGVVEATRRLRAQGLKNGGVARGCGAIMSDRRNKTKIV